jgi:hypothetical protein
LFDDPDLSQGVSFHMGFALACGRRGEQHFDVAAKMIDAFAVHSTRKLRSSLAAAIVGAETQAGIWITSGIGHGTALPY